MFYTVNLCIFKEGNCTQHATLEKVAKKVNKFVTLKSLSTTRWSCNYKVIATTKSNYFALVKNTGRYL